MQGSSYGKRKLNTVKRGILFIFLLNLAWVSGCASSFLKTGQKYMQQNNPAMGSEYFAEGLQDDSGNKALWDQYVVASLMNESRLRRAIEQLKSGGQDYSALKMLYVLYTYLTTAKEVGRGDARPMLLKDALKQTKEKAVQEIITEYEKGMQAHQTRGDLDTLGQAMALDPGNSLLKQRYETLLDMFKYYTVVHFDRHSAIRSNGIKKLISNRLRQAKNELIEPVSANSQKYNADIDLYIGRTQRFDTGWVMVGRRAYHKWVPRRNYKGQIIRETVRVCAKVIDAKGNPVVKCHKERKIVYMQVYGELRFFQRHIEVDIAYKALLNHLGRHSVARASAGTATDGASSRYFVYSGSRFARERPAGWPEGRRNARSLPHVKRLTERALYKISVDIAERLSNSIE